MAPPKKKKEKQTKNGIDKDICHIFALCHFTKRLRGKEFSHECTESEQVWGLHPYCHYTGEAPLPLLLVGALSFSPPALLLLGTCHILPPIHVFWHGAGLQHPTVELMLTSVVRKPGIQHP